MRELKFRAWDPTTKEMRESMPLIFPQGTIMQFTGLMDCKGREIFEGDVVRVEDYAVGTIQYGKAVFYVGFADGHKLALQDTCQDWLEVIGNVHEHPELMEDSSDTR